MARYLIQAKRKHENKWSEWDTSETYSRALERVEHAQSCGYDAKLAPSGAVKKLLDILGEDQTELAEKILDAGFCLRDVTVYHYIHDLRRKVNRKAVYSDNEKAPYVYLTVFDRILADCLKRLKDGECGE